MQSQRGDHVSSSSAQFFIPTFCQESTHFFHHYMKETLFNSLSKLLLNVPNSVVLYDCNQNQDVFI